MGLFKTYIEKYSSTILTNTNCAFVSVLSGSDSNSGTRELPVATITKANTLGKTFVLLNGMVTENPTVNTLIGDNSQSGVIGNLSSTGTNSSALVLSNIKCTGIVSSVPNSYMYRDIVTYQLNFPGVATYNPSFVNIFASIALFRGKAGAGQCQNITILSFLNYVAESSSLAYLVDSIILNSVDIYAFNGRTLTFYPVFKYCLFRKSVVWYWNSVVIPINWGNYGNAVGDYMTDVISAYRAYRTNISATTTLGISITSGATTSVTLTDGSLFGASGTIVINAITNFIFTSRVGNVLTGGSQVLPSISSGADVFLSSVDRLYYEQIFPNAITSPMFFVGTLGQTNKVVEDRPSVSGSTQIFNKYVGDTAVDYSLFLSSNNPALYMSSTTSYVGAYQGNIGGITFGSITHVDSGGTNTLTTPDLLVMNNDGSNSFYASPTSMQLRNRIQSVVLNYPRGFSFMGMQSLLTSGLPSRLYFGKVQPMITAGPYVTIPVETIEVIPYDDAVTPSAFPRFSASFNQTCQMWYKNSTNTPLLFNDLANPLFVGAGTIKNAGANSGVITGVGTSFTSYIIGDNITVPSGQIVRIQSIISATSMTTDPIVVNYSVTSVAFSVGVYTDKNLTEYGSWAVTNADMEDYSLSSKNVLANISSKNILIKYLKLELNLNYAT